MASDKGLTLDIVLADGVPNTIVTDEQRLQQILRNLLSNAFKFTGDGGVTLQIQRTGADQLAFSVIDTGIGIAQEKLDVIFEAFQQADGTTSRTYGGTGLGLSISRELARALGGELSVRSTPGSGSTFTLSLRLDAASRRPMPEAQLGYVPATTALALPPGRPTERDEHDGVTAADRRSLARAANRTRRLLVLDRGGLALDAIRTLVGRDRGVELTTALDADEALTVIRSLPPDCLVIGSRISKTAVFELLDELRDRNGNGRLPVILRLDRRVTERDRARLRRYEPGLLPRVAESDEELAAEAALLLHPASGPAIAGPDADPAPSDLSSPHLDGRVLLVDDDVRNLFALASVLEHRGLKVVCSETGPDALEILETDPQIDLVLMDIMMPQMDGYETIKAVRAMPALGALPIIAVTAKAMQGDREKSIEAGASDYITKPVDPDKLLSLIRGWLSVEQGLAKTDS